MEAAQELGKVGAGSDPYHDCVVPDCNVKHVFAHEVTICQQCKKETCYPHRFADKHACTKRATPAAAAPSSPSPRPQESPCSKPSCKVKIDPDHRKGDTCPKCRQIFCWTHQKDFNHDCKPPQSLLLQQTKSNPMDAFRSMFRSKNEARGKTSRTTAVSRSSGSKKNPIDLTGSSNGTKIPVGLSNRISSFRKTAPTPLATTSTSSTENIKGSSLPKDRRVVVYIQAEAPASSSGPETSSSKIPSIKAYFDSAKNVGQTLDVACGYLALQNNNNKDPDPNNWWSFYNLNRSADPIPENGMKFGDFAKDGDQLILMKGLAAFRTQS